MVAKRSQRLNVIGALLTSGAVADGKTVAQRAWLVALQFFDGPDRAGEQADVVILDNASIHTAKALEPYWELLKEKGLRFYFLPPCSPELNRIEILWKKMK